MSLSIKATRFRMNRTLGTGNCTIQTNNTEAILKSCACDCYLLQQPALAPGLWWCPPHLPVPQRAGSACRWSPGWASHFLAQMHVSWSLWEGTEPGTINSNTPLSGPRCPYTGEEPRKVIRIQLLTLAATLWLKLLVEKLGMGSESKVTLSCIYVIQYMWYDAIIRMLV